MYDHIPGDTGNERLYTALVGGPERERLVDEASLAMFRTTMSVVPGLFKQLPDIYKRAVPADVAAAIRLLKMAVLPMARIRTVKDQFPNGSPLLRMDVDGLPGNASTRIAHYHHATDYPGLVHYFGVPMRTFIQCPQLNEGEPVRPPVSIHFLDMMSYPSAGSVFEAVLAGDDTEAIPLDRFSLRTSHPDSRLQLLGSCQFGERLLPTGIWLWWMDTVEQGEDRAYGFTEN